MNRRINFRLKPMKTEQRFYVSYRRCPHLIFTFLKSQEAEQVYAKFKYKITRLYLFWDGTVLKTRL